MLTPEVEIFEVDIAIVGAGPAGLAAAREVSAAGATAALLDSYSRPGGQYFKQPPRAFRAKQPGRLHHDYLLPQTLFGVVAESPRLTLLTDTTVWTAYAGPEGFSLHCYRPDQGGLEVRAKKVILAPGAHDRALPFPGWDLPGVMTAGAIQTLANSQRVLPGRKIVLSGSGPFLLPVAALLAESGANLVGVFEAARPRDIFRYSASAWAGRAKLGEGAGYLRVLRHFGVPYKFGRAVVRAEGRERVERVSVARLNSDWSIVPDSLETLEVDAVGVGYGFSPSLDLSQLLGCEHRYDPVQAASFAVHDPRQQSTRPGVFVAGEICGIGGSAVALPQGAVAGLAAALDLSRVPARPDATARLAKYQAEARQAQAFAGTLNRMFALQPGWQTWATPETIICRCEEVTLGRVRTAISEFDLKNVKAVKLTTRCGMGLCQGRVCGPLVIAYTASLTGRDPAVIGSFSNRPIVRPIPLGELAR
jgi:NADPH-dependent 2,4-dienoyl-CoA reductase/sulfur reductase-like enzyme